MRRYFGTDGIRGRANDDPMTVETALRLGRAVATLYSKRGHRARILVGKDTRLSGYMFEPALVAGITSTGADVIATGPLPTPGIAFLTTSMRCDAGIVISASHNPFEDNGLKVFGSDGFKLPDEKEHELEATMDNPARCKLAHGTDLGRARRIEDANGRYVTHLKTLLRPEVDLEGVKMVVDCANGAAYKAAPLLFTELGASVVATGVSPDGTNINRDCGSMHPEHVAERVLATGAQLGIALDGDADRLILIDEKGQEVDGDAVLAMCALEMKSRDRLAHNTVVATIMSNVGLQRALSSAGIRLERTGVGDRYVVQRMREGGFTFGGEQSGHLIFLDHATTGDGLVAALQVLNVMLSQGRPLSELAAVMQRSPQLLRSYRVRSRPPLDSLPTLTQRTREAERQLGDDGRVVLRYSGTEPKVRIMVEGPDEALIADIVHRLAEALATDVGLDDSGSH
ncbi:MAG: phosphoglucosamine mutase [Myxococcales bacterium]|nr:phosphoglucosamine mutase [Myxococcales bacterium]